MATIHALAQANEAALPDFAVASMRLHQQLLLLLFGPESPACSEAVAALVAAEDAKALGELHRACVHKPQGSVATVLERLRASLRDRADWASGMVGRGGARPKPAPQVRRAGGKHTLQKPGGAPGPR